MVSKQWLKLFADCCLMQFLFSSRSNVKMNVKMTNYWSPGQNATGQNATVQTATGSGICLYCLQILFQFVALPFNESRSIAPPGQLPPPPVRCPQFFLPPWSIAAWIKRLPGQTSPPLSNDPSCKWQREHVQCYYVVIGTCIGAIFKNTHMKNHIWYGYELSEYDSVQSTVLVDG